MDDYRSWTKVDWMKIGLNKNRIGRKALDQNPLDEKVLDEKWAHGKGNKVTCANPHILPISSRNVLIDILHY